MIIEKQEEAGKAFAVIASGFFPVPFFMILSALFLTAGAAVAATAFLLAPGKASPDQLAPFLRRNFAHRGLHTEDKTIPENSLSAFRRAVDAGYGMELDVHLSKDGQVFVFHDDNTSRLCQKDARVEDLTIEELQTLSLCGTAEKIPLFSDVLALTDGRVPLIVELKTGQRNEELCQKTWQLLQSYKGDFCVESFDPRIVRWFRIHAPQIVRGQLACPARHYTVGPRFLIFLMSHCLVNFLGRPHFIAYQIGEKPLSVRAAERMGAVRFCYTSHDPVNEKTNDAVIFEFYKPGITF